MTTSVILGYARTPIGTFGGGLSTLTAMELGGVAIRGALAQAAIDVDAVQYVVMGHVLQAAQGQITSRQAAVQAGIGMDVPAETVNKVCLSGMTALNRADTLIRSGQFDVVVAGGMESMSMAPFALPKARFGYRMGNGEMLDLMMHDGLTDAFEGIAMGLSTENYQQQSISREDQDAWSARSHDRALQAWKDGVFDDEVVSVEVPQRKGDPITVSRDEGMREGTTGETLARLRPAFSKDGTITAGNASQISDGAAALVVASAEAAERLGAQPLAEIVGWDTVAGPDTSLLEQPANAMRKLADRASLDLAAADVVEINEAFASVAIASTRSLGLDEGKVNINGGGVALGHPIGATGARIAGHVITALRARGGGLGVASLCGGGGQGDAIALRVN